MKKLLYVFLLSPFLFSSVCYSQSISLTSLSSYSLCAGVTNFSVAYTTTGTFTNNQINVELSDKGGSFTNSQIIGSGTSSPIAATIPSNLPSGINYKVRLASISPVVRSNESAVITFSKITSLNIYNTQNDDITYNELNIMCTGRKLTVTTALTDTSGMTFQWGKDGVNILQSGNYSKYTLSSQARYTVSATQGTCPTINSPYGPYVYYYSTINWNTVVVVNGSTNQCNGNGIGLFAAAYTDSISYQWYRDNAPISGATSRNYTATQSGVYKYVGLDGGCNYNGNTPQLNIVPSTSIEVTDTLNRNLVNVCTGSIIKMFAKLTGGNNTAISYSWQRNGSNILGANNSSYVANQSGTYKAIATQSNCITNSSIFTLNQNSTISNPTIIFTDSVKCAGQTIHLSTNYYTNSAIFQWKKDNVNIIGANSSSYNATLTGNYNLSVIDNTCNSESSSKDLTIGGFQQSIKTSSWTDNSTWSCGSIPSLTDEVIINTGHIVSIPDNYSSVIKKLILKGTLLHGNNSVIGF
jgi:trimeric autotransporter adhesin